MHLDLLDPAAEAAMGHIELARWADLILIAPATADLIARLAQGVANDLLTTLVPVSYTHLDVYKRQGFTHMLRSRQGVFGAGRAVLLGMGDGFGRLADLLHRRQLRLQALGQLPVSYTHLDVYKRQAFMISKGGTSSPGS